jgi:hypothetical protein
LAEVTSFSHTFCSSSSPSLLLPDLYLFPYHKSLHLSLAPSSLYISPFLFLSFITISSSNLEIWMFEVWLRKNDDAVILFRQFLVDLYRLSLVAHFDRLYLCTIQAQWAILLFYVLFNHRCCILKKWISFIKISVSII